MTKGSGMKIAQEWIWKKVKLHHWMTLVHSSQFLAINKTMVFLLLFKLYHVHLIYLEFLCIYSVGSFSENICMNEIWS
jgi:hypothetical protein